MTSTRLFMSGIRLLLPPRELSTVMYRGDDAVKSQPYPPDTVDVQETPHSPGRMTERVKSLSLPTIKLPAELQNALDTVLSRMYAGNVTLSARSKIFVAEGYPSKKLTEDGQALAAYLQSRRRTIREEIRKDRASTVDSSWGDEGGDDRREPVLRYGEREAVAYAASRLPVTYGVTLRVLNEISQREPSFQPGTMLDFGSGLGTAVWAAHQLWGDSLYEYYCVDTSEEMGEMAASLRRGGEVIDPELEAEAKESIPGVYFRQYLPMSNKVKYDIVVSAYTLDDLLTEKLKRISIASLWRKTEEFLVFVEPGNWSGYENIIQARDMVLNATEWGSAYLGVSEGLGSEDLQGYVFAPCPHDLSCPLREGSKRPCHFAQRVQLAFSERHTLKHKACHIENFSYLILRKGHRAESSCGRLLQPVRKRTRHIICQLCCPDGGSKEVILTKRKHRDLYRQGRKSEWGDLLPLPAAKGVVQRSED